MNTITLECCFEDGTTHTQQFDLPLTIGRCKSAQVSIKSWRVTKQHTRLVAKHQGVYVEDLGSIGGTLLNGKRVHLAGPLKDKDEIIIGPCLIRCHLHNATAHSVTDAVEPQAVSQAQHPHHTAPSMVPSPPEPSWQLHRKQLHQALLKALDLRRRDISQLSDEALRQEATDCLQDIIAQDNSLPGDIDKAQLCQDVLNEAVGLGPLEPLLNDSDITEIMVNRYDEIYIEKGGLLTLSEQTFSGEQAVRGVIDRIVSPLGRRIDESSPMVDARLPDGSRLNAVIPPIALKGSNLTIRKFPKSRPSLEQLVGFGSLSPAMAQFLRACVQSKLNIVVSGGTGSGKTTLLNILSSFIGQRERIITIEDAAELKLQHPHLIGLEARPGNREGAGQVSIRDLVRNALRMRPDRIVVGECRGPEAFDMLVAMSTGHEGSLTTLHANSARDALARMETMIMMANMGLPLAAIREQIASSVDIIIQQSRLSSGKRVITAIVEVCGMESGTMKTQTLFSFQTHTGTHNAFIAHGLLPERFDRLRLDNAPLSPQWFSDHPPTEA